MFGLIVRRSFHVSQTAMAVTKSSVLAKLRKSTGYSVSNCKKALEMFPGDIIKAEEWLHSEAKSKGWAKWAKVQNRTAAQGLIGVCSRNNVGVMVEINCETDFVSRNSEFQEYVAKMLSGCMSYAEKLNVENDVAKEMLEESELSAVKCETSTLGELLVAATCKFSEKTVAKRAVLLKVKDEILLNCLSHPVSSCPSLNGAYLGKYGVLLASKKTISEEDGDAKSVELNICQHIIGMNPLSLGELTEKDILKFSNTDQNTLDSTSSESVEAEVNSECSEKTKESDNTYVEGQESSEKTEDSDDTYVEGQETVEMELKDSNETQLVFQPYLLDPNVTVGETIFKAGLEVVAFERFECGEGAEDEPKLAQSAAA